jgi:hypothetical protein
MTETSAIVVDPSTDESLAIRSVPLARAWRAGFRASEVAEQA